MRTMQLATFTLSRDCTLQSDTPIRSILCIGESAIPFMQQRGAASHGTLSTETLQMHFGRFVGTKPVQAPAAGQRALPTPACMAHGSVSRLMSQSYASQLLAPMKPVYAAVKAAACSQWGISRGTLQTDPAGGCLCGQQGVHADVSLSLQTLSLSLSLPLSGQLSAGSKPALHG